MRLLLAAALGLALATPAFAVTFRVTTTADSGKGSLREAIAAANRRPRSRIEITLGEEAVIVVASALPQLEAAGTLLDAGGATLREGEGCERPKGKTGCDGIVVAAPGVVVRNLRVAGFLFDGISVRGPRARHVKIDRVQAIDNRDDGIGVSDGAGPVDVSNCLLMGNGFRTKGKGLLVFDASQARLRDSVVVGNRDGITVTKRSTAKLENVVVAANFDKGVGASAGRVEGRDLVIAGNGRVAEIEEPAPNGDGLRVGLGGSATCRRCLIAGNNDTGVVVLDTASVQLTDSTIESNRGEPIEVSPEARFRDH